MHILEPKGPSKRANYLSWSFAMCKGGREVCVAVRAPGDGKRFSSPIPVRQIPPVYIKISAIIAFSSFGLFRLRQRSEVGKSQAVHLFYWVTSAQENGLTPVVFSCLSATFCASWV